MKSLRFPNRFVRRAVALFGLLAAATPLVAAPNMRPPPNIVFILLDNVGQEWFGCYGSEENCTPNIDRLAATGVRIENCYTPPVCGPSRTVLLTGRYPHSTGFRLHHDAALYSGGGLDPRREVLFPRALRDAGYVTGMTGKWQVNHLYDEPDVLTRHGFVEHLAWPGSVDEDKVKGAERERFLDAVRRESVEETVEFIQHIESRYWDPVFLRNGRREVHRGKFGPDVSHAFALDFMRRHRDKPFLLYLPMTLTHGETFTRPVIATPDAQRPGRSEQEMFADMLRYADKLVGNVVAELDRLGLRENTFVFVASDNGTESRFQGRRNGRTVKGALYTLTEPGGNVVLLANAPGRIAGGRTIPLADFTDIYPTLCDLTGTPVPRGHALDGQSFAGYLLGRPGAVRGRDWILNEYHETRLVRDARYKLYSDGRFFDLGSDPEEKTDLRASQLVSAATARRRLKQVLDRLPPDSPEPFLLRSQSGFKLRNEAREKKTGE
jgi:arylsulfatase A-like enzyme